MAQKLSLGSATLHKTFEGLRGKFESDFADMIAEKSLLILMGGQPIVSSQVFKIYPLNLIRGQRRIPVSCAENVIKIITKYVSHTFFTSI